MTTTDTRIAGEAVTGAAALSSYFWLHRNPQGVTRSHRTLQYAVLDYARGPLSRCTDRH